MSDEVNPQEVLTIASKILLMLGDTCACSDDVFIAALKVAGTTAQLRAEMIRPVPQEKVMTTAIFMYRCRLCGRVEDGGQTAASNAVSYMVDILCGKLPPGIPQMMHDVHYCTDGGIGISDLIGARTHA